MWRAAVTILALAATGCSKPNKIEERNASPEQVGKAIAKAGAEIHLTPGRWESTVEILGVSGPGIPASAAKTMQAAIGNGKRYASCLTPEQAARPGAGFFGKDARNCTYRHFTMGGGALDALLVCGAKETETVAMKGSFDPRHYAIAMDSTTNAGNSPVTVRMKIDSNQIGPCKGDESGA